LTNGNVFFYAKHGEHDLEQGGSCSFIPLKDLSEYLSSFGVAVGGLFETNWLYFKPTGAYVPMQLNE
jgi:hypothetical protein